MHIYVKTTPATSFENHTIFMAHSFHFSSPRGKRKKKKREI